MGAYVAFPIPGSPVPVVMSNFFVLLAGLLLDKWWAGWSMFVYVLLGAVGLPVYAGGVGGWDRFIGPTGGFLVAFIISAFVISWITAQRKPSWQVDLIAATIGVLLFFVIGIPRLMQVAGIDFKRAVEVGCLPFLPGGFFKILLAVVGAYWIRPLLPSGIKRHRTLA